MSPFSQQGHSAALGSTGSDGVYRSSACPLFVCTVMDFGGLETIWADLIPALRDRGMRPRLVAIARGGESLSRVAASGVPCDVIGAEGLRSLAHVPELLRLARESSVVVSVNFNADAVAAVAARLAGVPHVINWQVPPGKPRNWRNNAAERISGLLGSGAIAVIKPHIEILGNLGYRREAIKIVRNGARGPSSGGPASGLRGEIDATPGDFVAVLAGRLAPEKRVDRFVNAVAHAAARDSRIRGAVIGDGPLRSELEGIAAETGSPVEFLGYRDNPLAFSADADVFCLTSAVESMPMVLIEAASMGLPSIAMDSGGCGEVVDHGVTGLVLSNGDVEGMSRALFDLAQSPAQVSSMGKAAKQRWRDLFSFEAMVDEWEALLSTVSGPPVNWPE